MNLCPVCLELEFSFAVYQQTQTQEKKYIDEINAAAGQDQDFEGWIWQVEKPLALILMYILLKVNDFCNLWYGRLEMQCMYLFSWNEKIISKIYWRRPIMAIIKCN